MRDFKRQTLNVDDAYHALSEFYSTEDPIAVRDPRFPRWIETTVNDLYLASGLNDLADSVEIKYHGGGDDYGDDRYHGTLYEMVLDRQALYHERRAIETRQQWRAYRRSAARKRAAERDITGGRKRAVKKK